MLTQILSALRNIIAFADSGEIVLYCTLVGAVLGAICGGVAAIAAAKKRKTDSAKPSDEAAQRDVQPSKTANGAQENAVEEAITADYLVMSRNVIYSVGIDGKLNVGRYVVKNADDASAKFNMRVNGLVREYANGDVITLADGDTLSPVSGSVTIEAVKE